MQIKIENIKKLRLAEGLTQEDAAERLKISVRNYSRIESGKVKTSIWKFKEYMEKFGKNSDGWMLFLDTDEFEDYRLYKRLRRLDSNREFDEIRELLKRNEGWLEHKSLMFRQFCKHLSIKLDKEIPDGQAASELFGLMKMTRKKFDESAIADYRLNLVETGILTSAASRVFRMGEHGRAINIVKAMIESRGGRHATERDKAKFLPVLYSNLSTMLGNAGRHKESLDASTYGTDLCKEYGCLKWIPTLLYNSACSLFMIGEQEAIYKPYLVRAYYSALAFGRPDLAAITKEDAEKDFGILL